MRHKFSATKKLKTGFRHAELYKIIVQDYIECTFPNVDIDFHIFLTLMVTNCSAERPFSQLKYIKNPIRTNMQQGRLDALSLKYRSRWLDALSRIEADGWMPYLSSIEADGWMPYLSSIEADGWMPYLY